MYFVLRAKPTRDQAFPDSDAVVPFIFLPVLAGILSGALIGTYSGSDSALCSLAASVCSRVSASGFPDAFWRSFRFLLLTAFFASCCFGVILIPALAFIRAFILSCSVAALLRAGAFSGLTDAFFAIGIPALLEIPCFILCALDSFRLSARLLSAAFRRPPDGPGFSASLLLRHALLLFALTVVSSLYSVYVLCKLGIQL